MTTTPLDRIQAAAGPQGWHSRKPCPVEYLVGGARGIQAEVLVSLLPHLPTCKCHGTGIVLDTEDRWFKALWSPCYGIWYGDHDNDPTHCWICHGIGYVPRAEAIEDLWIAAQLTYGVTLTLYAWGECRAELHTPHGVGVADTSIEALCAALLTLPEWKKAP